LASAEGAELTAAGRVTAGRQVPASWAVLTRCDARVANSANAMAGLLSFIVTARKYGISRRSPRNRSTGTPGNSKQSHIVVNVTSALPAFAVWPIAGSMHEHHPFTPASTARGTPRIISAMPIVPVKQKQPARIGQSMKSSRPTNRVLLLGLVD
jgi:hypothetical protein